MKNTIPYKNQADKWELGTGIWNLTGNTKEIHQGNLQNLTARELRRGSFERRGCFSQRSQKKGATFKHQHFAIEFELQNHPAIRRPHYFLYNRENFGESMADRPTAPSNDETVVNGWPGKSFSTKQKVPSSACSSMVILGTAKRMLREKERRHRGGAATGVLPIALSIPNKVVWRSSRISASFAFFLPPFLPSSVLWVV
jgi:hypothetical protein